MYNPNVADKEDNFNYEEFNFINYFTKKNSEINKQDYYKDAWEIIRTSKSKGRLITEQNKEIIF